MNDPIFTYFLLCGSALLAGAVNAIAGGGTLLTFPALFSVLSGNGVLANGTSTVAIAPGSLASAWGYRKELADKRQVILRLLGPSLLGGGIGALLVTRFPQSVFNALVPWLILGAAVLFVIQQPVMRWLKSHPSSGPAKPRTVMLLLGFQLLVAIYGGYFGAGIGILMLTALSFMNLRDIHQMNAVKTILASTINGVSVVSFVWDGLVKWDYALAMAISAIIGGYFGARVARRLPAWVVRLIVIVIGFSLAAFYFVKQIRG